MTSTVFVCESAFESQHAKGVPRDDSSRSVPGLKHRERSAGRASEPRSTASRRRRSASQCSSIVFTARICGIWVGRRKRCV